MDMAQTVAVLVDGDNISGKHAAAILCIATQHGEPAVVRAYLDAQRGSEWHGAIGYRLLHSGMGKNATDVLLAIDAMELAYTRAAKSFVIATSDGDFTHLSMRLRELGAKVIGVGQSPASRAFRASCTVFVELDAQPAVMLVPKPMPKPAPKPVAKPGTVATKLDQKIRAVIAAHGKAGAAMPLAALGATMNTQHKIQTNALPDKNWRSYLAARPALYALDPRGPKAMVRTLPAGFAAAA